MKLGEVGDSRLVRVTYICGEDMPHLTGTLWGEMPWGEILLEDVTGGDNMPCNEDFVA